MSTSDVNERLSPSGSPMESLRVPTVPATNILQTGTTSAFRRVSPHSSPVENNTFSTYGAYPSRRDSDSHSDSGAIDQNDRTVDYSMQSRRHSEDCDSKCSCKSTKNNEQFRKTDGKTSPAVDDKSKNKDETLSNSQRTPTKPKLSFSVEAIMSTKTSPTSSQQNSQQHHNSQHASSREFSFSSPTSDRYKDNYSPATSEASSRESDLTSPLPHHPAHREGFEGLFGKAQASLPPHHPFLTAAGAAPDGVQWPWLGGHHPAPGPLSKFKFDLNFYNKF